MLKSPNFVRVIEVNTLLRFGPSESDANISIFLIGWYSKYDFFPFFITLALISVKNEIKLTIIVMYFILFSLVLLFVDLYENICDIDFIPFIFFVSIFFKCI